MFFVKKEKEMKIGQNASGLEAKGHQNASQHLKVVVSGGEVSVRPFF